MGTWCQLRLNAHLSLSVWLLSIICENDNFIWGQTTHGKISTILIKLVKTRLMNKKFISSSGAGVSELKSRRVLSELWGRVRGGVANNCKGWRRHSGGTAQSLITQNMIYTHRITSGHYHYHDQSDHLRWSHSHNDCSNLLIWCLKTPCIFVRIQKVGKDLRKTLIKVEWIKYDKILLGSKWNYVLSFYDKNILWL